MKQSNKRFRPVRRYPLAGVSLLAMLNLMAGGGGGAGSVVDVVGNNKPELRRQR